MKRYPLVKFVAIGLSLALPGLNLPPAVAGPTATLSGSILLTETQTPVVGGKLHAADPKSGRIYSSPAAGPDGGYLVEDLPAAVYELAVETDGALYLVQSPVRLAPGQAQVVHVALNPRPADDPDKGAGGSGKGASSLWNNPMTAALIVVGSAVVVGVVIDEATDDTDTSPSPSVPSS